MCHENGHLGCSAWAAFLYCSIWDELLAFRRLLLYSLLLHYTKKRARERTIEAANIVYWSSCGTVLCAQTHKRGIRSPKPHSSLFFLSFLTFVSLSLSLIFVAKPNRMTLASQMGDQHSPNSAFNSNPAGWNVMERPKGFSPSRQRKSFFYVSYFTIFCFISLRLDTRTTWINGKEPPAWPYYSQSLRPIKSGHVESIRPTPTNTNATWSF